MTGAECLLRTLLANGVELCFMNPGTSEMQFVSALDRVPAMRGVLCLFEGVCSGAADGYARMTGRPAATLLHLGPGLANGLANFHNARKARSPVVNLVGEHSTGHLPYDAPLTADTALFARTVSGWVRVLESAERMGAAASEAVAAAIQPPGQVATLIVPADLSWSEAGAPGAAAERPVRLAPDAARLREARRILRGREPAGLLLGGRALLAPGLAAAGRLGVPIFANRRYRILDIEMRRTGAGAPGPRANDMIDIGRPEPDWVRLSEGLGVAASRAATAGQFADQFAQAMRERGPRLIEAVIED